MRRLLLLALLLSSAQSLRAQCAGGGSHTLADLNPTTVQNCLNSINADNTTVILPAGSITWTTGVSYTANFSIVIQGAGAISSTNNGQGTTGTDQTSILDHLPGSAPLFNISTIAGKSFRFTGVAMKQDTATTSALGALTIGGSSTAVRVDHNHFILTLGNVDVFIQGAVQGVADHNYFDGTATSATDIVFTFRFENGASWQGDTAGWGDKSWTDTDHWGSSQFFFAEDNLFQNESLSDAHAGGRYVYRHNTITGPAAMQVYNHGETPGNTRATREAEVYNNNFTNTANNGNPTFSLNSGTLLYWGNVITGGYHGAVGIRYDFRTTAGGGGAYFYGDSWHFCGIPAGGPTNWDRNLDSSGYACIDQPGRGAGDLLTGNFTAGGGGKVNSTTGTISWPHQALSPIYIWNNTYTPQFYNDPSLFPMVTEGCGGICAANREYYFQFGTYNNAGTFNGTIGVGQGATAPVAGAYTNAPNCTAGTDPATGGVAPGVGWWNTSNNTLYVCTATNTWTVYYTPFTYPHPLTGGGVIPPTPPNPPTSLAGTVSASTVSLSWTASSGSPVPTAYTLYRGTVHGGPYSVVKSGLTSTSTTDTPPNGTWFYVVAAYVGGIVTNISGSGSVATVTCTTSCAFPTGALVAIGGNSVAAFNTTTTSTGQPNSSSFTFASSTSGTGTGGGAWQTASESAKSNEITVGVPASLTVTLLPASRTFANQTVGTSSPSQTAVLTNTSGAGNTVTISSKSISTGPNPGDFSFTDNCPSLLLSGLNCTFNITFTPTAGGARSANLQVFDNASGSPQAVALSGTGVAQTPGVSLNPTSLNFGDQTLSTTSTTRSIILTNTGSGTLTITSVVASGDFAVVTVPVTNCGGTLASLATCSLNVTFTPTATGGRTGAVTVTDNAAGSPHVATLSGNGITTKCQVTGNVTLSGTGTVCP